VPNEHVSSFSANLFLQSLLANHGLLSQAQLLWSAASLILRKPSRRAILTDDWRNIAITLIDGIASANAFDYLNN
jgi:hypothetical protein